MKQLVAVGVYFFFPFFFLIKKKLENLIGKAILKLLQGIPKARTTSMYRKMVVHDLLTPGSQ